MLNQTIVGPKMFWVPNFFGPKFALDLSIDYKNIHVQNTFLTDSKQIQFFFENLFGSKYFLTQNVFGPKYVYLEPKTLRVKKYFDPNIFSKIF